MRDWISCPIIYSAAINSVVSVPIIFMLIMIANNGKIVGQYANNMLSNIVSISTLTVMAISTALMMYTFFSR